MIDFDNLWEKVVRECAPRGLSVHGRDHWGRVERNALVLATRTGASVEVVRIFALLHDSQRLNEGYDREHGARAAIYASTLRGTAFDLPDGDFDRLVEACTWHTAAGRHEDPTIGTCWDADRLDLGRVGIIPSPKYMSTAFGAEIAAFGSICPWSHLVPEGYLQP